MYKLVCNQDPIALGIQDESGAWDMDVFKEHIKSCPACQKFAGCLLQDLTDTVNGFLKRKRTIGEVRKANKNAKEVIK